MNRKDGFSSKVVATLAERAGKHCCFPDCTMTTSGPSNETDNSVSNTGTACHISAASPGRNARRYDASLTSEYRSSINNGIWMCRTHGKLIDDDEEIYTVEQLKKWKEAGEQRARVWQTHGRNAAVNFFQLGLAVQEVNVDSSIGYINQIGLAVEQSCIPVIWGKELAHTIRDFLIEYAQNALTHGEAKRVILTIEKDKVLIKDDGKDFDSWQFVHKVQGRGGAKAFRNLISQVSKNLLVSVTRKESWNENIISLINSDTKITEITSCVIELDTMQLSQGVIVGGVHEFCRNIYIVLPSFLAFSHIHRLSHQIEGFIKHSSKPVLIVTRSLSQEVQKFLKESIPNAIFMHF